MKGRKGAQEQGFTLVEVLVAMVITVLVMTSLSYVVLSSLKTIQQAKQRQTATALATQELERLRALPYDTVTKAVGGATVEAGQLYVTPAGLFTPPASLLPGVSEPLVVNTVSGQWHDAPVDKVTYRVFTYVAQPPATTSGSQTFSLTAIVSWTSSVWPAGRTVVERSTTFSPAGCLSTATSPFAAPCQAYVTARAGEALSGLTVSDPNDSTVPILGSNALQVLLNRESTSTSLLSEQTTTGSAIAAPSSAVVKGDVPAASGGSAAKVAVDSDPSSVPNQSATSSTPGYTTTSLVVSGPGGSLIATPSSADTGTARSAVAADSGICAAVPGPGGLTTGPSGQLRPCSSAVLQSGGTAATLQYASPLLPSNIQLTSFGVDAAPSTAVSASLGSYNSGACNTGATIDCVHSAASRQLGPVTFGASPFTAGGAPAGFSAAAGVWSVSGFKESAYAEEGRGVATPSFSYSRQGTLQVWSTSGYTTVDLSQWGPDPTGTLPVSQSIDIPDFAVGYGSGVTLTYSGSVMVQRPKITRSPGVRTGDVSVDCKIQACVTSVDGSASIVATVNVKVQVNGSDLTTFAAVTDLGGLTADVSYKVAANA